MSDCFLWTVLKAPSVPSSLSFQDPINLEGEASLPSRQSQIRNQQSKMSKCPRRDSNPEPTDYESAALTVELQGHRVVNSRVLSVLPPTVAVSSDSALSILPTVNCYVKW